MKKWVEEAKFAAVLTLILGGCAVFYSLAWFAEGYQDGRFMPNEEDQFNTTSILVILGAVVALWFVAPEIVPLIIKALYS